MYGIGFGSVVPDTPAGQMATGTSQISAPLQILFGQTPAIVRYAGLAPTLVRAVSIQRGSADGAGQRSCATHVHPERRSGLADSGYAVHQ